MRNGSVYARPWMIGLRDEVLPDDEETPVPAGPEVRARLEAIFKDKTQLKRLHAIARAIVKKAGGLKRRDVDRTGDRPLYGNELIDELVMEAVTRVLEGRRKWDTEQHPDAFAYFGGVIGSLWTHFARGEKTRRQKEQEVADGERPFDWHTRRPRTPLELLIEKEEEEEYRLMRADFEAEFDRDTRTGRLALSFLAVTQNEVYDPGEQARLLGITIEETYRLRERVKRVLDRFLETYKRRNR